MSETLLSETLTFEPDAFHYQHDKFPPGRNIRRSSSNFEEKKYQSENRYHRNVIYDQNGVMDNNDLSKCQKGSINFRLPRLPSDKYYILRRNSTCSYVQNHKIYLKMKGFDLNHMYSLKRNRMNVAGKTSSSAENHNEVKNIFKSVINITEPVKYEISANDRIIFQKKSEQVWRLDDSRKFKYLPLSYKFCTQGPDAETNIYGQRRVGYLSNKPLGKIMTRTHIRSLLALQEPETPRTHYMEFIDSLQR